jgi:hypothetical protein
MVFYEVPHLILLRVVFSDNAMVLGEEKGHCSTILGHAGRVMNAE